MIFFSIITNTYNRISSGYLDDCIRSIQSQKGSGFKYEHIIVDDGSTDKTKEFVLSKIKNDSHIKYIHRENGGPAKAFQTGLKEAKGDYVFYVDDDDMLSENSLQKRADFIKKNPDLDWFYGLAEWVDAKGEKTKVGFQSQYFDDFSYERMLIGSIVHSGTATIKMKAAREVKWPNWLKRSQDYFLWLELFRPEKKLKVGFLDDVVYRYRWHDDMYTAQWLADKKKFEKKMELNNRIRSLHPKNLVFMAQEVLKTRDKLEEVYKEFKQALDEEKLANTQFLEINTKLEKNISKLYASPFVINALRMENLYSKIKKLFKKNKSDQN